jgi:ribosomal protein S18 acetylase RimI-like enzyme
MNDIVIRKATQADLNHIMDIEVSSFDETVIEDDDTYRHRIATQVTCVAVDPSDRIVGCMVLQNKNYIASNAVLPEYRGRGISRKMLRWVMGHANYPITLSVRSDWAHARQLYASEGFVPVKSFASHTEHEMIEMIKSIPSIR